MALPAQTKTVLAALAAQQSQWRHGYDLARDTKLKSGTLYPILIRLADRKMVEACSEAERPAGQPRRHTYRLTGPGLTSAAAQGSASVGRQRRTAAWQWLVGEGS
jgi:DNA-binding PadR family transcriptional regulator